MSNHTIFTIFFFLTGYRESAVRRSLPTVQRTKTKDVRLLQTSDGGTVQRIPPVFLGRREQGQMGRLVVVGDDGQGRSDEDVRGGNRQIRGNDAAKSGGARLDVNEL